MIWRVNITHVAVCISRRNTKLSSAVKSRRYSEAITFDDDSQKLAWNCGQTFVFLHDLFMISWLSLLPHADELFRRRVKCLIPYWMHSSLSSPLTLYWIPAADHSRCLALFRQTGDESFVLRRLWGGSMAYFNDENGELFLLNCLPPSLTYSVVHCGSVHAAVSKTVIGIFMSWAQNISRHDLGCRLPHHSFGELCTDRI